MSISKELLQEYIGLLMERQRYDERIQQMKSSEIMPAQKESDGSQHGGSSGDSMARNIERRIAYEKKMEDSIKSNAIKMSMVEHAVAGLKNPLEREVIRLRYIEPRIDNETGRETYRRMKWTEITNVLYGSEDDCYLKSVSRLHTNALQNLLK